MNEKQQEELVVRFEHTLFYNDENGFTISRYKLARESESMAKGSVLIAKGLNLPAHRNTLIFLTGTWEFDPQRNGRFLMVDYFDIELPQSRDGVVCFLCGLKVGIGAKTAEAIYDKFGESVWNVLDNSPDDLNQVKGVTSARLEKLKNALYITRVPRKILQEFRGCEEMTPARAMSIYEKHGPNALEIIKDNPYVLCQMRGFGFQTVDAIAKSMDNWHPSRPERLNAGIQTVFQANGTKGHTCVPKRQAVNDLNRILEVNDIDTCKTAFNSAHKERRCIVKGDFCYSRANFLAEKSVAENVLRLLRQKPMQTVSEKKLDEFISNFESENSFELAPEQRKAVKSCFQSNLCIITGGPGTGKSTIIKAILYVANAIDEETSAMLMAPTGRAARRMQETTGHDASTIHSALGIRYSSADMKLGTMEDQDPLETDFVIVDEVSMIDQFIANCLFSRIGDYTSVILVGDCDQLPSVGAGNVLAELIRAEIVPVHRLNVIFRQQQGNPIIINSQKVRIGDTDLEFNNTFKLLDRRDPNEIFALTCNFFVKCVKQFGLDNVVLLVPHRRKGQICADTLNAAIQNRLNPALSEDKRPVLRRNGKEFRIGDKVMQTRNTDIAKNGDIGYIVDIVDRASQKAPDKFVRYCDIKFEGCPLVSYSGSEMSDVDLAYAQSIHKSQGAEFNTAVIVMSGEHELMARRNLLYTAITRAKEHVALIGEFDIFKKAIVSCEAEQRYTQLADFIHVLDKTVPDGIDPRYYTPDPNY